MDAEESRKESIKIQKKNCKRGEKAFEVKLGYAYSSPRLQCGKNKKDALKKWNSQWKGRRAFRDMILKKQYELVEV